jgi:hypothetical protein
MAVNGKSSGASAPLLKNSAAAPVIYFDSAPVHGTLAGNIEVELATRVLLPKSDGHVLAEMVCVAHLRCCPAAAQALMESLQHALAMHHNAGRTIDGDVQTLNS